jgi:hypothetical protein
MVVRLPGLRAGRVLLPRNIFWSSFLLAAVMCTVRSKGSDKLQTFNYFIGNRTHRLVACSEGLEPVKPALVLDDQIIKYSGDSRCTNRDANQVSPEHP